MRIAILTLPLRNNYGGILQAYALQTVLENMGHEVEVIKWPTPEFMGFSLYKMPFIILKRLLQGKELFKEYRMRREKGIVFQHVTNSINGLIHFSSRIIGSQHDLIDYCNNRNVDALIVGSDQVWRKSYGDNSFFNKILPQNKFPSLETYFLDFVGKLRTRPKSLSYAASFGTESTEFTNYEIEHFGNLIRNFDAVSVREEQGLNMIRNTYSWNVNACQTLDPTLLLTKDQYLCLCTNHKCEGHYLLYYALDENNEKKIILDKLSKDRSLPVKVVSPNNNEGAPDSRILPSVEEWLSMFAHADYVLTDSFHGMVFSIIFHKNFLVIGNSKRGLSRFTSLLSMVGLSDRLVCFNRPLPISLGDDVVWSECDKKLRGETIKSLNYVISNLCC